VTFVMGGLAGLYHPRGLDPDPALIQAMAGRLAHRGPDAEGFHLGSRVHLASRRLSVIDPAPGPSPPPTRPPTSRSSSASLT
jgi:asparagine synthase (glutamine-hydrolysing)